MADKPSRYWWVRHFWLLVMFPLIGALAVAGVGVLKGWLHQRVGYDSEGNRLKETGPQVVSPAPREPISALDMYRNIVDDLQRRDLEARPRLRYLTLLHRYNDPVCSEADLDADRLAVRDMAALLSHGRSARIDFIDPTQLVFRLDLEDLDWDAETGWHQVATAYRYGLGGEGEGRLARLRRQVGETTQDSIPVVRADWFVAALTHAPLAAPTGLVRVAFDELPASIRELSHRYSGQTLDLASCSRELSLPDSKTLSDLIRRDDHLQREFGLAPLLKGERIRREWWESDRNLISPYQELARLTKLGKPVRIQ
jgi:hypothetical protein